MTSEDFHRRVADIARDLVAEAQLLRSAAQLDNLRDLPPLGRRLLVEDLEDAVRIVREVQQETVGASRPG